MTVLEKDDTERVEKIDKDTQLTMSTKQICLLIRQKIRECIQKMRMTEAAEELSKVYLNHPALFIVCLFGVASIFIPIFVVISIIAIHVFIAIVFFVIFEAIIILSSTAVMSFFFLIFVSSLIVAGISILAIYLSTYWFVGKLKNFRKNFFYDIVQY